MKVIVVEDDAVIGVDLTLMLQDWGYTTDGPHGTVAKALEAIAAVHPDFVFLDIELLDGENSLPVAQRLRELGIPFICMSGYTSDPRSDPAFANAPYLEKPVQPKEIRNAISTLLGHPPP